MPLRHLISRKFKVGPALIAGALALVLLSGCGETKEERRARQAEEKAVCLHILNTYQFELVKAGDDRNAAEYVLDILNGVDLSGIDQSVDSMNESGCPQDSMRSAWEEWRVERTVRLHSEALALFDKAVESVARTGTGKAPLVGAGCLNALADLHGELADIEPGFAAEAVAELLARPENSEIAGRLADEECDPGRLQTFQTKGK